MITQDEQSKNLYPSQFKPVQQQEHRAGSTIFRTLANNSCSKHRDTQWLLLLGMSFNTTVSHDIKWWIVYDLGCIKLLSNKSTQSLCYPSHFERLGKQCNSPLVSYIQRFMRSLHHRYIHVCSCICSRWGTYSASLMHKQLLRQCKGTELINGSTVICLNGQDRMAWHIFALHDVFANSNNQCIEQML